MAIEKTFKIIDNNIDEADFCGPIDIEMIESAEEILDVKFSKSYRMFLERYGAGDIFGIEIYGIIQNPETDGQMVPNGVWLTHNLREESALPEEYMVIAETGYGPYYVLDTSKKDNNLESPIYIWDEGNQKEKISDSFGEFLFSLLKESM